MPDHVHMLISIPPKYAVSQVVGYIKGKSAIHVSRVYGERKRNFVGQHFWARGYYVSTVGCDERVIRAYSGRLVRPIRGSTCQLRDSRRPGSHIHDSDDNSGNKQYDRKQEDS